MAEWNDENRVLYAMLHFPADSIADWARHCGWVNSADLPAKSKVHRILHSLDEAKLVRNVRKRWSLTDAGKREAEGIRGRGESEERFLERPLERRVAFQGRVPTGTMRNDGSWNDRESHDASIT